jgi:hypothetical protein
MKKVTAALLVAIALPAFAQSYIVGKDTKRGLIGPLELFRPLGASDTYAGRVAHKKEVIFNSGSVAAGASISSDVMDLTGVENVQIEIDNRSGTALRRLMLETYADDGVTLIGTAVPLRTVAYGNPPAGGQNFPGMVFGAIGPRASTGSPVVTQLYDATSASGGALTNTVVVTEDCDTVQVSKINSSGSNTMNIDRFEDDGSARTGSIYAGASVASEMKTLGESLSSDAQGMVPRRIQISSSAITSQTTRMVVLCRGRPPGTFAVPMMLPTKAKFILGAGGSGAAAMVVYAQ